jgi:hypothetical protein
MSLACTDCNGQSTDAPPKNWLKYGQLSTANVSEQVAGQHTVIASAQRQLGLQSSEMIVDSDSSMNLAAGGSQYQSLHFSVSTCFGVATQKRC